MFGHSATVGWENHAASIRHVSGSQFTESERYVARFLAHLRGASDDRALDVAGRMRMVSRIAGESRKQCPVD
jgi:hypothetical protein